MPEHATDVQDSELADYYRQKYMEIFGQNPLRSGNRNDIIVNLLDLNSIRTFRENCHAVERNQLFDDAS